VRADNAVSIGEVRGDIGKVRERLDMLGERVFRIEGKLYMFQRGQPPQGTEPPESGEPPQGTELN